MTLIKSVTSSLLVYTMHTIELPRFICNEIDKYNRSFLWGDIKHKKKMHLVNWNQCCKWKDIEGLGIKSTRHLISFFSLSLDGG